MTTATRQTEYIKLENRLVLLAWLNDLFGALDIGQIDRAIVHYGTIETIRCIMPGEALYAKIDTAGDR